MRTRWHALHADLVRTANRHSFLRRFRDLRDRQADLAPWREPAALLDALHAPGGDPEARNRVLRALVEDAQGNPDEAAQVLLLIALWPGLDAVHGRLWRFWQDAPENLAGEILGRVAIAIRTLDLDRVHRVAATLLKNVERDLRRTLKADSAIRRHADDGAVLAHLAAPPEIAAGAAILARDLAGLLGPDAGLVLDIAIAGTAQREACAARGLPYEAGRKRYRRALEKLRCIAGADVPDSSRDRLFPNDGRIRGSSGRCR